MAPRRITRKEMKRDDFATLVGQVSHWAEGHAREVLIGLAVVIVVVIAFVLMGRYSRQREERASMLLARGIQLLQAPVQSPDPATGDLSGTSFASEEERYRAVLDQMDAVRQTYPRTDAALLAIYYRGLAYLNLHQPEQAIPALEEFLDQRSSGPLAPMAQAALAQAHLQSGHPEQAYELYEELAQEPQGSFPPQAALLEMGRCLEVMGRQDEARDVYERIRREFPGSEFSREADLRLAEVS